MPLLQAAVALQVALEELLPQVLVELQLSQEVPLPLLQAAAALLQEVSSEVVGKGP